MPGELGLDAGDGTDERDAEIEVACRRQRAVHDVAGREVSTHRVNGDPHHYASDVLRCRRFMASRGSVSPL
jgi:hypothetical protein